MAVWESACQKLDIARSLWEDGLIHDALGNTLSPYMTAGGDECPLEYDMTWEDVAEELGWLDPEYPYAEFLADKEIDVWHVGLNAVYQLIRWSFEGRFQAAPITRASRVKSVASEVARLVACSTQMPIGKFLAEWELEDHKLIEIANRLEVIAERFKSTRHVFKDDEVTKIDQDRYFGGGKRCYYGAAKKGNAVFLGAQELKNHALFLTKRHLNFLIGSLIRLSNTLKFFALNYHAHKTVTKAALSMVAMQVRAAARAKGERCHWAARAFHKARALAQMRYQENVKDEAAEIHLDSMAKEGLLDICDIPKYLAIVESVPREFRAEITQTYKWMPPPDFDTTECFAQCKKHHRNPRKGGYSGPDASLWEMVLRERKINIATAYKVVNGSYPEGSTNDKGVLTNASLDAWVPEDLFQYIKLRTDIASQIKDKTTVKARLAAEQDGQETSDSYLLWFLSVYGEFSTEIGNLSELGEENYSRVAYKPEAAKPFSRLFYMAPPKTRTLLGELEGNLSKIARIYPGSLQGKTSAEKKHLINNVVDPHSLPAGVDFADDHEIFIIQFDAEKWSLESSYEVTHDYHTFWSKVYGLPIIEEMAQIGCKGRLLHTTAGLKMTYTNTGADLEGYRGRLMTMFHADMLGAACRLSRDRGFTLGKAPLAVFIDDGIVKIAAKGNGSTAIANVNGFLGCLKEVYAACGQKCSPPKTMISKHGGEILAEQYYDGVRMPMAVKAAMRLAPSYENIAVSLPEELDALFSTAQGMVKDQARWIPAYRMYVEAFVSRVLCWSGRSHSKLTNFELALKVITPKSAGGFGLSSLQQLVSSGTVNATCEGYGMLNTCYRACPDSRSAILDILELPVVKRTPVQMFRDPTRIRLGTPVMAENRLLVATVRWFKSSNVKMSQKFKDLRSLDLDAHASSVAEAILGGSKLSYPFLRRAWAALPLAQLEAILGKVKKSDTMMRMLGGKKISRIRKRNILDVKAVLKK